MKSNIGRNDPCPCGSGKKAKHCHGTEALRADVAETSGPAWRVAADWLQAQHGRAMDECLSDFMVQELWPEEAGEPQDYPESVETAIAPWVIELWLACGGIRLGRRYHRPCELAANGLAGRLPQPLLEELTLLGETPLRLYRVVERTGDGGWQLLDALDFERAALDIPAPETIPPLRAGALVAARIATLGLRPRLIGLCYEFPASDEIQVMNAVRDAEEDEYESDEERVWNVELEIGAQWLRFALEQFTEDRDEPADDETEGEAAGDLLHVTDHYEILDEARLGAALDGTASLRSDLSPGWLLAEDNELDLDLGALEIVPGTRAGRLEVLYASLLEADIGRPWFDDLAGDSVRYLTREISDPVSMRDEDIMRELEALPPEALNQLLNEDVARQVLLGWLDEPIPELGGVTPREAAANPASAARVRSLLVSLEQGAEVFARSQGAKPMDTQVLWDELGFER